MQPVFDLETLDGIAYMTRPDATICAIGSRRWDSFASANGAPELADRAVIGRNLFEFVSGDDVRTSLRYALLQLSTRARPGWVMPFRCDTPDRQRNMRQSITPIFDGKACSGFLFQSIELRCEHRPTMALFDFKANGKRAAEDPALPLVVLCSWCQRVRYPPITGTDWMEAEDYYSAGGRSKVRISHGICALCAGSIESGAD